MSEAIWGSGNIDWSESGGHVLPLRHPEWCARHVLDLRIRASSRSAAVARPSERGRPSYESHAGVQRDVAERLATAPADHSRPRVLELGCGTGLFSRHLVARYPDGQLPADRPRAGDARRMPPQSRARAAATSASRSWMPSRPVADGPFDLIAIEHDAALAHRSRCRAAAAARLLAPGGSAALRALADQSFPEWREVLERWRLPSGLVEFPAASRRDR